MSLRAFLFAFFALLIATPALAQETIERFDVAIEVERDGDIVVTETIDVISQGIAIQRGIFRDLPRYYDLNGERLPYSYDVLRVTRDGEREDYETETDGNAYRIRIGDPDVFISDGAHRYEMRYLVKNQVRYFPAYAELYWNVTGNYWAFPIVSARATITLPPGAQVTQQAGYTGGQGATGHDYSYNFDAGRHVFETTKPLGAEAGLTVALGFAKGAVEPPSAADQGALWWQRFGALAVLIASLGGLFLFLYQSFERVGRDPLKGPVFPRYEPPAGYSPGAAHHIYYRTLRGHRALIATLMNLAVRGRITIDAASKKETTLTRAMGELDATGLAPEDLTLETSIFDGARAKTLGRSEDADFTSAYTSFRSKLGARYGTPYFRFNVGYMVVAAMLSIFVVIFVALQTTNWTGWHTLGILALAALNVAFIFLLPAPTVKGQQIRTEIEGLRLYMETAEKLQLNAVKVGADAPPPMTKERYERFLPYAVALGVEEPWTKHFERLIPEEAARYQPGWTNLSGAHALGAATAMVANMSSGVASAMPQSSGSSGSGGGGSSGGGGGGGGGGGW